MIYFFELIHPIIEPKITDEQPNKVILSPISLDVSKKTPQIQATINPIPIKYSTFFSYMLEVYVFYAFNYKT
jgi:hypothetical protein